MGEGKRGGERDTPAEAVTPRVGPCTGRKAFLSPSESASDFALPFPRTIPTFTVKGLLQTHTRTCIFGRRGKIPREPLLG